MAFAIDARKKKQPKQMNDSKTLFPSEKGFFIFYKIALGTGIILVQIGIQISK